LSQRYVALETLTPLQPKLKAIDAFNYPLIPFTIPIEMVVDLSEQGSLDSRTPTNRRKAMLFGF